MIVLELAAIVTGVLLVGIAVKAVQLLGPLLRVTLGGERSVGLVSAVETDARGRPYLRVKFRPADGAMISYRERLSFNGSEGEKRPIRYDPTDPSDTATSYPKARLIRNSILLPLGFGGGGVYLAVAGIYGLGGGNFAAALVPVGIAACLLTAVTFGLTAKMAGESAEGSTAQRRIIAAVGGAAMAVLGIAGV